MAAQKRKAPLSEACKLLTAFAAAEEKMLKYAKENATWCGIPPQIIQQIRSAMPSRRKRARTCASWPPIRRARPDRP